jgi:hypothetical protein
MAPVVTEREFKPERRPIGRLHPFRNSGGDASALAASDLDGSGDDRVIP